MSKVKVLEKFKPLYTFEGRYIIITGGRGSAKSFSVSVFILILIYKQYNEVVLFTRKTMTSAHKSIIPEFIEKITFLLCKICRAHYDFKILSFDIQFLSFFLPIVGNSMSFSFSL